MITYRIGNAQTIGTCEVQSNYFSIWQKNGILAILADGTIDHYNGRRSAIIAVKKSLQEYSQKPKRLEIPDFFESLSMQICYQLRESIYLGKTPHLSFTIVYWNTFDFYYYSVGENQLFLFDGENYMILKEQNGYCRIKAPIIAGLLSKGVYQALSEIELLDLLSLSLHPYEKAQCMMESINKKQLKKVLNSTVILIEGKE